MRLSRLQVRREAHEEAIWATAWSSKNVLLTGSVDETVMLWQEVDDELRIEHTFMGQSLGVICVAVHELGSIAATSSLDSMVRVWDIDDRQTTLHLLELPPTDCWHIDFCPDSAQLLLAVSGGASGCVNIWDLKDKDARVKQTLKLPKKEAGDMKKQRRRQFVLSSVYSPDGRKIAASGMDGVVVVFDVETGAAISRLEGHTKPVRTVAFTPDSKVIVTGSDDMHVHMYDASQGSMIAAMSGHDSWVLSLAAHPSGTHFVSSSSDSTIKLWDVSARACVQTVKDHTDQVWGACFRSDGSRLASVSDDGAIAIHAVG